VSYLAFRLFDTVSGLCRLSPVITAVVSERQRDASNPNKLKDKRLKRLVKQLLPGLQAMAWCLAPLGRAIKLFETGSLASVLQTVATIQGLWTKIGADTASATALLNAAFNGKQHFSGTIGHRETLPKSAGSKLAGFYGVQSVSTGRGKSRGTEMVASIPPAVGVAADKDGDDISFSAIAAPSDGELLKLDDSDDDSPLSALPQLPEMPSPADMKRTFATALLASLMAYGFDVRTLAGCTSSVGRLYTRAALANPQWDIVHALDTSGLEPEVVAAVMSHVSREETLIQERTTPQQALVTPVASTSDVTNVAELSHTDIGDQLFHHARALRPVPDVESEYTSFRRVRARDSSEFTGSANLQQLCEWWVQRKGQFPLAYRELMPLVLTSASSSDAERAGSTTQSIIGTRATQMGDESLKIRTLLKANLTTALAIARRRASPVLLGGGLELSRSATLAYRSGELPVIGSSTSV
jgi:hypothetical protein